MKKLPWNTEEFENICTDIIEKIVSIDIKQTRSEAIIIAKKLYNKALESGKEHIQMVYERVVNELKIATDTEYNMLRKAIFSN